MNLKKERMYDTRKKIVYFVMIGEWCFCLFFSIWAKSIFGIIAFSILGAMGIIIYFRGDLNRPPTGRERDITWSFEG